MTSIASDTATLHELLKVLSLDLPAIRAHEGEDIVNLSGVYALIFHSQIPAARQFRKWVRRTLLPSVRAAGGLTDSHRQQLQWHMTSIFGQSVPANVQWFK